MNRHTPVLAQRPAPCPFWPKDRLDRLFCLYIAALNLALLAVIGLRVYLQGGI